MPGHNYVSISCHFLIGFVLMSSLLREQCFVGCGLGESPPSINHKPIPTLVCGGAGGWRYK
jgi:hypothetical protein